MFRCLCTVNETCLGNPQDSRSISILSSSIPPLHWWTWKNVPNRRNPCARKGNPLAVKPIDRCCCKFSLADDDEEMSLNEQSEEKKIRTDDKKERLWPYGFDRGCIEGTSIRMHRNNVTTKEAFEPLRIKKSQLFEIIIDGDGRWMGLAW